MKKEYGIVSQEVMQNNNLSVEAKAIYAYLSSIAGNGNSCSPAIKTMQRELNIGKDRLYKHMNQLIDAGVVEKYATKNKKGGFSSNTYRLVPNMQIMVGKERV